MTQEELDTINSICTLSKILFFQKIHQFGLSVKQVVAKISEKKTFSESKSYRYLYDKACTYRMGNKITKEEFIEYILK